MVINNYGDIAIAIRQHKIIRNANFAELEYHKDILTSHTPTLLTTVRLDGMPASKYPHVPIDIVLEKIDMLSKRVYAENKVIRKLKKQKKAYEDLLYSLNTLHYFIAQMYIIDQMSLKEIAVKINYNYDYIRHIAGDLKQKFALTAEDHSTI